MRGGPVRIGVLGTASIATRFMLPALAGLADRFRVVAVASRSAERAAAFSLKTGVPCRHGYRELLDSGEIDAVYIPLPNGLHHEWAGQALDCGLHVLCEKSLAVTKAEAMDLIARSETAGLALMETFGFRFHSQLQWIRDALESRRVGEVRALAASFGFPPFSDPANIRYDRALGGGALLDAGAYTLRLAAMLLGPECRVAGAVLSSEPGAGVDLHGGGMVVDAARSRFMSVAFGFDHEYRCRLEVWGSEGSIQMDRIFTAPPGFEPPVQITGQQGTEVIRLPADDHFTNMLLAFHGMVSAGGDAGERDGMRLQAQLMDQFRTAAT